MKMLPGLENLVRCISLTMALLALTACSNVITPQPTAEALPTNTPPPIAPTPTQDSIATAPLVPPADTPTSTITPTPIIHIIQSGDTLLGIALDYGVDVDKLQSFNGIDSPQSLQVGQELIIPTGGEESEEAPELLLSTPTPQPLGVRGVAFYETPVGSLWCLGEIVNTTNVPITNVQVRVMLFDAVGERVAEADTFAAVDLISPGERSPFGILFTKPPANWANSQVTLVRGEAAGEMSDSYVSISLAEVTGQPSGPQFHVSGVARNNSGEQNAGSVRVIATTYDDQGVVTGMRQTKAEIDGSLAPGATAPFSLLFSFHGDAPADFNVVALGYVSAE